MPLACNAHCLWCGSRCCNKPSHLARLPHIGHNLGCICRTPHQKLLAGIDVDGNFCTAAAKTDPGGLCELLVRTIVENTLLRGFAHYDIWFGNIEDEAKYYFSLDPFLFTGFHAEGYAPDFHVESFGGRQV